MGLKLQNLSVGQVADFSEGNLFEAEDGDGNQESITNNAIQVWENMACFRFALTDNQNVDHFARPSHEDLSQRLPTNLQRTRSAC